MDEDVEEVVGRIGPSADEVESAIDDICERDDVFGWERNVDIDLGVKRWRPAALSSDRKTLLHVSLGGQIPRYVRDRLRRANDAGYGVVIALTVDALFLPDVLRMLSELDASVFVLDDYRVERRGEKRHFLAALADLDVPLVPELRREIGAECWSRLDQGTSQEKGRRLEALLAFVFSQVSDLKVVERNFRTASEEIDLVLQVDNFSGRAWQKPGVPFILVEAKNTQAKASQPMVSILLTKLQTNRGTTKIAFLVSPSGFTDDAILQEMRFSTGDFCVVMIDRRGMEKLLSAGDIGEELEILVRRSMLR